MDLAFADILVVVLYFAIVLFIGFVIARRKERYESSTEGFILAGRKLTLPLLVGTLVATWYGSILGVGEFVYRSGFVAWVSFGLPYYIAAGFFAAFLAKKVRSSNVTTIPEQITKFYGKRAGWISSLIVLIITVPAAYILMLGVLVDLFTGWGLFLSVLFGTVISMAYLFTGGFRADVYTNAAQFIFMFLGFGALLYFSQSQLGSFSEMSSNLPQHFLEPMGDLPWQYVAAWYIIAFQTFVDPSFHQRCSAAKTPAIAQRGVIVSIGFWAIFDFLTLMAGLYAKAYFDIENPLMAYPVLSDAVLPVIWKGIFLTAMIAAVMSTLDSYAFISAATIGNDILKPIFKKRRKTQRELSPKMLTGLGLLITGVVGIIMAIAIPSVVELIFKTASIVVPSLIFPLTISMSRRYEFSGASAIKIMVITAFVSLVWTVLKDYEVPFFVLLEPMFAGIVTSGLISAFYIRKRKIYLNTSAL